MELLPDTSSQMKDVWSDPVNRQNAKTVLIAGFHNLEIPVTQVMQFLHNLDELLDSKEEVTKPIKETAL